MVKCNRLHSSVALIIIIIISSSINKIFLLFVVVLFSQWCNHKLLAELVVH